MRKWMITNLEVYSKRGANYEGYVDFIIWDQKYHCWDITNFIRAFNRFRDIDFTILNWCDFKVVDYQMDDKWILFQIELLHSNIAQRNTYLRANYTY